MGVKVVVGNPNFAPAFKHPVKFNGTDFVETRLTQEEMTAEVSKMATSKLHVFLERYGSWLTKEELRALAASPGADAPESRFWLERLLADPIGESSRHKKERRRRWMWAQRQMELPAGFFSEDNMKLRDPKLFHHLVGRHLDPTTSLSAPMQGSLSTYLMQRLEQECELDGRSAPATGSTAGAGAPVGGSRDASMDGTGGVAAQASAKRQRDEDEDDDAMSEDEHLSGASAGPNDDALRRARLLKSMRDRFVNGEEPEFDYGQIDNDSDLDDVEELGRDAEEKYFDDDAAGLSDDEDL